MDTIKWIKIHIMGIHNEKRKKGQRAYSKKIMMENFPNLRKEMDRQIQEAQKPPTRISPKRSTLRHIITQLSKVRDKGQSW